MTLAITAASLIAQMITRQRALRPRELSHPITNLLQWNSTEVLQ